MLLMYLLMLGKIPFDREGSADLCESLTDFLPPSVDMLVKEF